MDRIKSAEERSHFEGLAKGDRIAYCLEAIRRDDAKDADSILDSESSIPSKQASVSATATKSPVKFANPSVSRSSSAEKSTKSDDILNEQYELAKRYFQHQRSQMALANQIASSNLSLQELQTDQTIKRTVNDSDVLAGVTDWMECFDPRSKRWYYYSASLKKSTWKKPSHLLPSTTSSEQVLSSSLNAPSAAASANVNALSTPMHGSGASYRSESPAGPLRTWNSQRQPLSTQGYASTSSVSGYSASNNRSLNGSSSMSSGIRRPSPAEKLQMQSPWVTAVDPKSNRQYWYNR